ncbi:MAG: hypothetical protein QM582_17540 [Micropruina sp.]|uniref:hypothetical protein n=1 Tax=Micropruina sp. TaxID=2737536 RepID=UPI0039E65276
MVAIATAGHQWLIFVNLIGTVADSITAASFGSLVLDSFLGVLRVLAGLMMALGFVALMSENRGAPRASDETQSNHEGVTRS